MLACFRTSTPFDASFDCPVGGQSIDYGIDNNGDSVLDVAEIDGNAVICSDMCITVPFEVTHSFSNIGTFTTSLLDLGNVAIAGTPGNINVLNLNGLGVVGGSSDVNVDSGESIAFSFNRPALIVSYSVSSAGNGDADGLVGEAFIEAFAMDKTSLGTADVNGVGTFDVSQMFGNVPITSFTVTAYADNFVFHYSLSRPVNKRGRVKTLSVSS
ncbi:MAG: hypothetical protein ACC707_17840 [Thiohalomonadales bacterium]